jgi:hypothetical protein
MGSISTYEAIVQKHGLSAILAGGDLQVTPSGDIAVTDDGDVKFGNDVCNAMHRLVQRWSSNCRVLDTLFDLTQVDEMRRQNAQADREAIGKAYFTHPSLIHKFHSLGEEVEVGEFGAAACAGAVMVVLSNLLLRYRTDLTPENAKWENVSPRFNGCSFGEVVLAAANNFRHHDEWARTRRPTSQQKKSIVIVQRALAWTPLSPAIGDPWRRNACADLIAVISDREFATLERNFFEFAKAMLG